MTSAFVVHLDVPYVNQHEPLPGLDPRVGQYACGPASAAMVAAYKRGGAPRFRDAVEVAGGNAIVGQGVQPWAVAKVITSLAPGRSSDCTHEKSAKSAGGLLTWQLRQGQPVIALVRPSWVTTSLNHFVVVSGLDTQRGVVVINDPIAGKNLAVGDHIFQKAWEQVRWLPPFSYVWVK